MFKNRLITFFSFGLVIYLIVLTAKNILSLKNAENIVVDYEKELQIEERKNQSLKERYEETKQPGFIEREARDKLGMGKEGESIVIMPKITIIPTPKKEEELSNIEKWWKLFFK